jgi:hypothetical protein
MRLARNSQIVKAENGQFIGINLGADFVAEHEWGIKGIKRAFGIEQTEDRLVGLERRVITRVPELFYKKNYKIKTRPNIREVEREFNVLIFASAFNYKYYDESLPREMNFFYNYEESDLQCAWSEGSFGIVMKNSEYLDELFEAIQDKNVVIGRFGGGIFENAGLGVYIADRLPSEVINSWIEADQKEYYIKQLDEEIGIRAQFDYFNSKSQRYSEQPFGYFALSPKLIDEEWKKERNTDYDLIYWLNPMGQDKNNYGWFTVEELEAWLEGKGPIPKKENV